METAQKSFLSVERRKSFRGKSKKERSFEFLLSNILQRKEWKPFENNWPIGSRSSINNLKQPIVHRICFKSKDATGKMNRERNLSFRSTVVAPEISTKATLVLLKYRLCGSKFSDHELQTIIKGATKSNLPKTKAKLLHQA